MYGSIGLPVGSTGPGLTSVVSGCATGAGCGGCVTCSVAVTCGSAGAGGCAGGWACGAHAANTSIRITSSFFI